MASLPLPDTLFPEPRGENLGWLLGGEEDAAFPFARLGSTIVDDDELEDVPEGVGVLEVVRDEEAAKEGEGGPPPRPCGDPAIGVPAEDSDPDPDPVTDPDPGPLEPLSLSLVG